MSACESIVLDVAQGSPEWRELRKKYLGASESAIILGCSKWGKAAAVAAEKRGEAGDREVSDAMERGTLLEPLIREAYSRMKGSEVVPGKMLVHPVHGWMAASLDGTMIDEDEEDVVVEIKTVNSHAYGSGDWGATGTDEIPEYYFIQVQHQLAVSGLKRARLVALVAPVETMALLAGMAKAGADRGWLVEAVLGIGLQEYTIHRSEPLIELIVQEGAAWWQAHVVDGLPVIEPERRQDSGIVLAADEDDEKLLEDLKGAKIDAALAEESLENLEDRVKRRIGDASGIEGKVGKVAWKLAKGTEKTDTDWEAVAVGIAAQMEVTDLLNRLVKENTKTTTKPGTRRFITPRNWLTSKKES
jgi:putative phage-type endonuclease